MSHLLISFLERLFFNREAGFDFSTSGCRIVVGGESVFIFADLGALVADEKALKEALLCKETSSFQAMMIPMRCNTPWPCYGTALPKNLLGSCI